MIATVPDKGLFWFQCALGHSFRKFVLSSSPETRRCPMCGKQAKRNPLRDLKGQLDRQIGI